MTDVRLTALNPEDSTVVPVACNSSGELLVDKGEPEGPDLNVEGDLSVGGSITAAGNLNVGGYLASLNTASGVKVFDSGKIYLQNDGTGPIDYTPFRIYYGSALKAQFTNQGDLTTEGSAVFASDVSMKGSQIKCGTYDTRSTSGIGINVFSGSKAATLYVKGEGASNTSEAIVVQNGNDPDNDVNVSVKYDGSAVFNGSIDSGSFIACNRQATGDQFGLLVKTNDQVKLIAKPSGTYIGTNLTNANGVIGGSAIDLLTSGEGKFSGDVTVGSRSKSWMLVEQGGLCHMVEQTRSLIDEGFSVDVDADEYPKLRDVFNELDLIERSLSQVMEKLRLTPPAGWPVWDGSDETQ
jgi:hypothetical protein